MATRGCVEMAPAPPQTWATSSLPVRTVVSKDNLFSNSGAGGAIPDRGERQILGWICLPLVPVFCNPEIFFFVINSNSIIEFRK